MCPFQRSFKKELFNDACSRLERASIKSPEEIDAFRNLAARANDISVQNMKKEIDFNDAPEEFRGR